MTDTSITVRANLEAEESLLGAAFVSRDVMARRSSEVAAADFHHPAYRKIWGAMLALHEEGAPVDNVTVVDYLRLHGQLEDIGGVSTIVELQANTPAASHAGRYAAIIRREASARRLIKAAQDAQRAINEGADPGEIADVLEEAVRKLDRAGTMPERYWRSTADYLAAEKTELGEPVIPGLIGPRGRTIVLATEKGGKSTLLRQMAECMASGIHPWTFEELPAPIRVLILDAENDDDELEQTLPYIDEILSARLGPDRGRPALFSQPFAMDLRSRSGLGALEETLEDCRPQVIVGGPIVNLYRRRRGESEDEIISDLKGVFNDIRRRWGCALVIEHHSKTDRTGGLSSKGGQAWDAWTNATIGLYAKDGGAYVNVKHEHPPRGRIGWPKKFTRATRAGELPWIPGFKTGELSVTRPSELTPPRDAPFEEMPDPGPNQEEMF